MLSFISVYMEIFIFILFSYVDTLMNIMEENLKLKNIGSNYSKIN